MQIKKWRRASLIACLIFLTLISTKAKTVTAQAYKIVQINYVKPGKIAVWNNYQANRHPTGQYLTHGSRWRVISQKRDRQGQLWYDLGKNQWIMARYTCRPYLQSRQPKIVSQAPRYQNRLPYREQAAKNWIAYRESRFQYNARNGQYIGRYQLAAAYLHGDFSPANQERTADRYVYRRYGSWVNAKRAWLSRGWY